MRDGIKPVLQGPNSTQALTSATNSRLLVSTGACSKGCEARAEAIVMQASRTPIIRLAMVMIVADACISWQASGFSASGAQI